MLGSVQSLLNDVEYRVDVASHQSGHVEPEPGKDLAAQDTIGTARSTVRTALHDSRTNPLCARAPAR